MFLTRSIRRKMVVGLALVLVMLAILSFSGIMGVLSFRDLVNDPDFNASRGVHRADLVDSVALLLQPLHPLDYRDRVGFDERLDTVGSQLSTFRSRLVDQPPSLPNQFTSTLLQQIEHGLDELEFNYYAATQDGGLSRQKSEQLQISVARLIRVAQQVPETKDAKWIKIKAARGEYRSRFALVATSTVIVVLLFSGLVWFGYRSIFAPIRELHQGAARVAQGDFDYRVTLDTNDEMSELADSFNQMTERFQEIAHDLDRQVQDRSRQLVRSERLVSAGFLAANVAHEINNPLTAIKWTIESLQSRMESLLDGVEQEERDVVMRYLSMIASESFRCQQITAKLLDFSRGDDTVRSHTNVTQTIQEVMALIGHMSKFRDRHIDLTESTPCFCVVNCPEIKQVILNLVANSLESMETGGRLTISLQQQTDHFVITFADNGCGMTPDVLANLFEPFFTKKQNGKGTGLGLSISHRIISEHGGTIEATSDGLGHGSTFRVRLPRGMQISDAA